MTMRWYEESLSDQRLLKFVAPDGGWFKPGTTVTLAPEDDCGNAGGVFYGIRVCADSVAEGGRLVGEEYYDGEMCPWSEFGLSQSPFKETPWRTRKDDHDLLTDEQADSFLRNHMTGPDNQGRRTLGSLLHLHPGAKVLDAACGGAVNYETFTNMGLDIQYTGLDRTPKLLEAARRRYPQIDLHEGYVEEMPFEDGEFDIVILRHILEHLEEGYEVAVKEALRVASKEVVVVFFLTPTMADDHQLEERPSGDNTGYTHWWNTYSWPLFAGFVKPLVSDVQTRQVITPGAAHCDTIVRLIK